MKMMEEEEFRIIAHANLRLRHCQYAVTMGTVMLDWPECAALHLFVAGILWLGYRMCYATVCYWFTWVASGG